MKSVCIRCGTIKSMPWKRCPSCAFTPEGEDLVKSVYCSLGRIGDSDEEEYARAAYSTRLDEISRAIKGGESIQYDAAELERIRKQKRLLESISLFTVWGAVFRLFLPVILFIGFLLALYLWATWDAGTAK